MWPASGQKQGEDDEETSSTCDRICGPETRNGDNRRAHLIGSWLPVLASLVLIWSSLDSRAAAWSLQPATKLSTLANGAQSNRAGWSPMAGTSASPPAPELTKLHPHQQQQQQQQQQQLRRQATTEPQSRQRDLNQAHQLGKRLASVVQTNPEEAQRQPLGLQLSCPQLKFLWSQMRSVYPWLAAHLTQRLSTGPARAPVPLAPLERILDEAERLARDNQLGRSSSAADQRVRPLSPWLARIMGNPSYARLVSILLRPKLSPTPAEEHRANPVLASESSISPANELYVPATDQDQEFGRVASYPHELARPLQTGARSSLLIDQFRTLAEEPSVGTSNKEPGGQPDEATPDQEQLQAAEDGGRGVISGSRYLAGSPLRRHQQLMDGLRLAGPAGVATEQSAHESGELLQTNADPSYGRIFLSPSNERLAGSTDETSNPSQHQHHHYHHHQNRQHQHQNHHQGLQLLADPVVSQAPDVAIVASSLAGPDDPNESRFGSNMGDSLDDGLSVWHTRSLRPSQPSLVPDETKQNPPIDKQSKHSVPNSLDALL